MNPYFSFFTFWRFNGWSVPLVTRLMSGRSVKWRISMLMLLFNSFTFYVRMHVFGQRWCWSTRRKISKIAHVIWIWELKKNKINRNYYEKFKNEMIFIVNCFMTVKTFKWLKMKENQNFENIESRFSPSVWADDRFVVDLSSFAEFVIETKRNKYWKWHEFGMQFKNLQFVCEDVSSAPSLCHGAVVSVLSLASRNALANGLYFIFKDVTYIAIVNFVF